MNQYLEQIFYNGAVIVREDGTELTGPHLQAALFQRQNADPLCRSDQPSELLLQQLSARLFGRKFLGYGARPGNPHQPDNIQDWDWVCYTSGTTGYYKAVGHKWSTAQQYIESSTPYWGLDDSSVMLMQAPYSSMGIYSPAWPTLIAGGRVVYKPFNPYTWCDDVAHIRPTHGFMIPRMMQLVSMTKAFENADFSHYKLNCLGGNFFNQRIVEQFGDRGMKWRYCYGSTELTPPVCFSDTTSVFKNWLPGFEYKLEDDGEMLARWSSQENWHRTGDLFIQKDSGVLSMVGRKSFMIKHRDFRVQPEQVETVAKYLNTVNECLLTLEDEKLTLKYEGDVDLSQLKDILHEHLEKHLVPSRYVRVDELPKNLMGKLIRPYIPVA